MHENRTKGGRDGAGSGKMIQLGVLALVVGGLVVLTLKGADTTAYIGLVSPILAAVFVVNHLGKQDEVLGQIQHNTNGVLSERIEKAVQKALDAREVR